MDKQTKKPRNGLLYDSQWVNIVEEARTADCMEDAVIVAAMLTEECIRGNLEVAKVYVARHGLVRDALDVLRSLLDYEENVRLGCPLMAASRYDKIILAARVAVQAATILSASTSYNENLKFAGPLANATLYDKAITEK